MLSWTMGRVVPHKIWNSKPSRCRKYLEKPWCRGRDSNPQAIAGEGF